MGITVSIRNERVVSKWDPTKPVPAGTTFVLSSDYVNLAVHSTWVVFGTQDADVVISGLEKPFADFVLYSGVRTGQIYGITFVDWNNQNWERVQHIQSGAIIGFGEVNFVVGLISRGTQSLEGQLMAASYSRRSSNSEQVLALMFNELDRAEKQIHEEIDRSYRHVTAVVGQAFRNTRASVEVLARQRSQS